MADKRFFDKAGPFSLKDIVARINCTVSDETRLSLIVTDVAPLDSAGPATLSFLFNRRYKATLDQTKAGAVLLTQQDAPHLPESAIGLISNDPYYDFAKVSQLFYPEPVVEAQIHPTAHIEETAQIDSSVRLEAGCSIGDHVVLGAGVVIGANSVIERGVTIGANTRIGPNVYIGYADIGEGCRIHSGARIGTRGFGFAMSPKGHLDIPQTGRVQIGSFVEIGANTAIDRGMGPDTIIGDGCKIDNLVQIGHNVVMGRGCVLAGQAGVAGSTKLGNFVACGAQSGIAGHLTIGDGAQIAAKSGVIGDVGPGEKVGGYPATSMRQWLKQHAFVATLMRKGRNKE
ncbi:MAG: UDP-3-O-(3-hydroxymyristoyl)glucosamine N-acyltransferase [Alphaproteobacteria bacterium]|nr:UDP-3-O-(3-hydroxymyristoyl)glucosamine N-acyltransferase [Alphaproteobacteria bacterium]